MGAIIDSWNPMFLLKTALVSIMSTVAHITPPNKSCMRPFSSPQYPRTPKEPRLRGGIGARQGAPKTIGAD